MGKTGRESGTAAKGAAVLAPIPEKRFFTIGEAAELVGVAASVLRFWEEEFRQLSPGRHGSRRRYEKKDILMAREIRFLVYERGYTIAGAKKFLKKRRINERIESRVSPQDVVFELVAIKKSIQDFLS